MKKKALIVLLVLIVAMSSLVALAACNKEDDKNTITFYHTMGSNLSVILDEYIEKFNALYNPAYKIKWEQVGNYDDVRNQIKTELNANKHPNMAYCYPDHVALYNAYGATATLDEYINSTEEITLKDGTKTIVGLTEEEKNDFIQGYYNEGKQYGDSKMYSMPFSKSTEVLYYNKTFFDDYNKNRKEGEAELVVPTHWWCTDACPADCNASMEKVCRAIKAKNKDYIPLGYDSEANWFITMCEQQGSAYTGYEDGNRFLFDNAENKAFVQKFRSWYQEGLVTTQSLNGKYTSNLFVNKKSFMSIGSSAGATHQRPEKKDGKYLFDVGIASIPQVDQSNPKVISQGPSVCIFKDNDKEREKVTWLFLKYLTTNVKFQAKFSDASGYVPVLKSVANDPTYKANLDEANGGDNIAYLSAKVCMEQEDAYYTSPAFVGSSDARDQVGKLLAACMSDAGANIDQLFANAVRECKYAIGE